MQLERFSDERGSAVLEFVGFGLVLQLLILFAALQITEVQKHQLAAEAIARHALRSLIISDVAVDATANQVATDFGITQAPKLFLACNPDCQTAGALAQLKVVVGKAVAQAAMRVE